MAKRDRTKSFVLPVDAAAMEGREAWAADEFRSINGQLQWHIADALRRSGRIKKVTENTNETARQNSGPEDPAGEI